MSVKQKKYQEDTVHRLEMEARLEIRAAPSDKTWSCVELYREQLALMDEGLSHAEACRQADEKLGIDEYGNLLSGPKF